MSFAPAAAQPAQSPAAVTSIQGEVYVDGVPANALPSPAIGYHSVLQTGAGRAEVSLDALSAIWIGEHTALQPVPGVSGQTSIELDSGSAVVRTGTTKADTTMVRLGAATITLRNAGIYRLDAAPARLRVIRGAGTVEIAGIRWSVAPGKELDLAGAPSLAKFDLHNLDALDQWSSRQASLRAAATHRPDSILAANARDAASPRPAASTIWPVMDRSQQPSLSNANKPSSVLFWRDHMGQ
jgi:hypothetical protein